MILRILRIQLCVALFLTVLSRVEKNSRVFAQDAADTPTRVVIVLRSADEIVADLKHMTVDLAGEEEKWDDAVFPNIDIFLLGVHREKPIRFDQVIDGEGARRLQMGVPYSDLKTFIDENLDPIGIIVKQDKQDKSLYKLSDLYEGWMRTGRGYAAFAEKDFISDIPDDLGDLVQQHAPLLEQGYDVGVLVDNSGMSLEDRRDGYKTFQENVLAGVKKRPDETREAYALRYANSENSLDTMGQVYVESTSITVGLTTDVEKNEGRGELLLVPVEGSELAKHIAELAKEPSLFRNVQSADNAVLSGRLNFALDDMLKEQVIEINKLSRPVAHQKIDEDENIGDAQKKARKQISDLLFDLLDGAVETGVWDGFVEITPHDSGMHTGVFATRTADGTKAAQIVELLPKSRDGYGAEMNVEKAGDVEIHKVTMGEEYPKAFQDFFGKDGVVYVGTSTDAVWLSIGDGSLEAMQAGVAAVAEGGEGEEDRTIARVDLKLLPVLKLMYQLRQDGDFDLMQTLNQAAEESSSPEESDEEEEPSETAEMLKDFQWRKRRSRRSPGRRTASISYWSGPKRGTSPEKRTPPRGFSRRWAN